jgi:hypothetical protein
LHSITSGNALKATQVLQHLYKTSSLLEHSPDPIIDEILAPDPAAAGMNRKDKVARLKTKGVIADRVVEAVQMLKGPPSAFEIFAKSIRGQAAGGAAVVEQFVGQQWQALSAGVRSKWNEKHSTEARKYPICCEANGLAYKLVLVLAAPPLAKERDAAGKGRAVAKLLGVERAHSRGAGEGLCTFAEAQQLRDQLDTGLRKVWMPDGRAPRKDRLADLVKSLAQRFWTAECPAMPGMYIPNSYALVL